MIAAPFEKTYLSRAQSRIWSMDNPVGDPFGGTAYGEKREPVSMIAAVVSIGMGATAVATATTTLAAVMGGLMIAGGAAAAIGSVSGNKQLTMIGGIVAGVGGLGLSATNLLADAAATTATSAIDAGATSAEQMGAQGFNAYSADEIAAMQKVGEQAVQELNAAPTVAETTAASFQAPNAAFDPSTITAPNSVDAANTSGLINNVLDTNTAGNVALNEGVVNSLTPDSVLQEINDTASSNVKNMLADSSGLPQYASNQTITDVPIGSSPIPENSQPFDLAKVAAEGNQRTVNSLRALGLDSGVQPEGQTPFPGFESSPQSQGQSYAQLNNTGSSASNTATESWLDKVEGIAKGIEKYKTTAMLGGNLISGAMKYAIPSQVDQATIDAYNAKANLANAEANALAAAEERRRRQNEAVKNMKPVQLNNASNPIFGGALNGAGIINSARA